MKPFQLIAAGVFALTFLTGVASAQEKTKSSGSCALEPSLQEALLSKFGSSTVLTTADLFEDERKLFIEDHKAACPGLAKGQFFGAKQRPAIALIVTNVGPKGESVLVMARPALKTWIFLEVERMEKGSTAVVWKDDPGSYDDGHGGPKKIAPNDVVVLTGYEAWQRVYMWTGSKFEFVQTAS